MSKKDDSDKNKGASKKVLATGASGDPDNPAVGAPVGAPVFVETPVVVETTPQRTNTPKETDK